MMYIQPDWACLPLTIVLENLQWRDHYNQTWLTARLKGVACEIFISCLQSAALEAE